MTRPQPFHKTSRWLDHAGPLALCLALALATAWPLWLAPASRLENLSDPQLNAWIMAWDHYAIFHRLFDFFQADVYWPHANALAYGEHLITQALLMLPLRALTTNPVALHNLCVIQGFFLSAAGAYALGYYHFRRIGPATVAALAYGFAGYRISHSQHIQLIHGEFLPLMVLGFEWALAGGGRRASWLLGLAALGQWLASGYWAIFTLGCLGPYYAARLWRERRALRLGRLAAIGVPLLAAALCVLPTVLPYVELKRLNFLFRPPESAAAFTAHFSDYLIAPGRSLLYSEVLRGTPSPELRGERALFPGLFVTLGFLTALTLAMRRHGAPGQDAVNEGGPGAPGIPLRLWGVITVFLLSLTLGPQITWGGGAHALPLPLALVRHLPLASEMRVPARWILPAELGLALLAAESWRRLARARFRWARLAAGAAFCLLVAESLTRPLPYATLPAQTPEALAWLNRQPYPAPVLMLPLNHRYLMLEAAWLHQPLANGTNGYFPPVHPQVLAELSRDFPAPGSIDRLKRLGIRFVVINTAEAALPSPGWTPARLPAILAALPPSLPVMKQGDHTVIDLGAEPLDAGQIKAFYFQVEADVRTHGRKVYPEHVSF